MQSHYAATFEREMGCTLAEWAAWLPRACGAHWPQAGSQASVGTSACDPGLSPALSHAISALHTLVAHVDDGQLTLRWAQLTPRRLGSAVLPRMWVRFDFQGLGDPQRQAFMRRFDLYTQRGGG